MNYKFHRNDSQQFAAGINETCNSNEENLDREIECFQISNQ